jgi:hypothetical protein
MLRRFKSKYYIQIYVWEVTTRFPEAMSPNTQKGSRYILYLHTPLTEQFHEQAAGVRNFYRISQNLLWNS